MLRLQKVLPRACDFSGRWCLQVISIVGVGMAPSAFLERWQNKICTLSSHRIDHLCRLKVALVETTTPVALSAPSESELEEEELELEFVLEDVDDEVVFDRLGSGELGSLPLISSGGGGGNAKRSPLPLPLPLQLHLPRANTGIKKRITAFSQQKHFRGNDLLSENTCNNEKHIRRNVIGSFDLLTRMFFFKATRLLTTPANTCVNCFCSFTLFDDELKNFEMQARKDLEEDITLEDFNEFSFDEFKERKGIIIDEDLEGALSFDEWKEKKL